MHDLVTLDPGLQRLRAPNPSPMTHTGTNTYLLGQGPFAVIDPGPDLAPHLAAILEATGGDISHIFVTHAHLDHSPLAAPLSTTTGAPVLAYGDARAGRSKIMQNLADIGGGEGVDTAFAPDQRLRDGQITVGPDWSLQAIWTPGHFGNHLSFLWKNILFSGDLVMGWASSLVSPPDGDLTDFMASCRRLEKLQARCIYPGHGDPVADPGARIGWLIAHRQMREAQIRTALSDGPANADMLAARLYTDIPARMLPAASRNVLAHLIDLYQKREVSCLGELTDASMFRLA